MNVQENNSINKEKKSGDKQKSKRREKGAGTIRKKGNSYEGRITVTVNGIKKQVSFTNKDKRVVVQKMNEAKGELENNTYVLSNRVTVREWMIKWINSYKRGMVKNNTLNGYIDNVNNYIIPEIGDIELQQVQVIHVQELMSRMKSGRCKTTDKCLSAKTIKDVYCILNMAFKAAKENNLLKNNVIEKVEPPKLRKNEPQIMTRNEQKEFEKLLENKYQFVVYLFILKTGERASEVAGTDWDDIDFNNKKVRVRNGLVTTGIFDLELNKEKNIVEDSDLKSETSSRDIPMLFGLYDLLKKYRDDYMEINNIKSINELKGKPLFLTSKNNRLKADFLWTKLERYLKKNNFRHIGVHQLRHTFATRCLESGISVKYLQKLLGHASTRMTDRYTHLLFEFEQEENAKIDEYYNKIMKKEKQRRIIYKGKIKGRTETFS